MPGRSHRAVHSLWRGGDEVIPSPPLGCVAGQVKGPFVPAQADVIPGNHSALGATFGPGCLPACRLCPVLFGVWGGLREHLVVGGDTVSSQLSNNRVT